MNNIQSIKNPSVKEWSKLHTAKGRKKAQQYLLEGAHLIEEALKADVEICTIMVEEKRYEEYRELLVGHEVVLVSSEVSKHLSLTQTSQGIFAVVAMKKQQSSNQRGKFLLIDGVQDPGNLGTIVRTADAAGFDAVVLGKGTVDLYNDKTLRSMQGSHFHIDVYDADLLEWLKNFEGETFATALDENAKSYHVLAGKKQVAIVVGNEGQGVRQEVIDACGQTVMIPIFGDAESLNVAVASALVMY